MFKVSDDSIYIFFFLNTQKLNKTKKKAEKNQSKKMLGATTLEPPYSPVSYESIVKNKDR